jgi:hypothetical protein
MAPGAEDLWHRTPLGLFVPRRYSQVATARTDFTIVTLGYRDLFGASRTLDDVVALLSRSSLEGLCQLVGRIDAALYAGASELAPWDTQVAIVRRLYDARSKEILELALRAKRKDRSIERVALFHERQLLNLLKIAFLVLPVDNSSNLDASAAADALLILNDLLDQPLGNDAEPDYVDRLELFIFANTVFNQEPDAVHELVRSYEFYVSPRPEILGHPMAVDIPSLLKRATKADPQTLWRILFVLFGYWFSLDIKDLDEGTHVRRLDWFASMSRVTPEDSERFFHMAGRSAADFQAAIKGAYNLNDLQLFDVVEFAKTPLVFFQDRVVCTSIHLLRSAAGPGLQHRFLDQHIFSPGERKRFLDFRGVLYSDYVCRLLRRVFGTRLVDDAALDAAFADESHCDAIVDYGDAALLFEIKAVLVPLAVSAGRDLATYQAFMAEAIPRAATQLYATIELIEAGRLATLGLRPERLQRYYPLIVTLHLPSNPLTYRRRIEEGLSIHPLMQPHARFSVAPLQLLDVHDVEAIESVANRGRSLRDLLELKNANAHTRYMALINFLATVNITLHADHNPYLAQQYQLLSDEALEYFRELGLSDIGGST